MTTQTVRRGMLVLAALAATAAIAITAVAFTLSGRSPGPTFPLWVPKTIAT